MGKQSSAYMATMEQQARDRAKDKRIADLESEVRILTAERDTLRAMDEQPMTPTGLAVQPHSSDRPVDWGKVRGDAAGDTAPEDATTVEEPKSEG